MVRPKYISGCINKELLTESMEAMLEAIASNIDLGYQIEIDAVTQLIQNGMTLETFNLLALNLNRELSSQYEKNGGSYGFVMNYKQTTIH